MTMASKRLIKELQQSQSEHSPALSQVGLVDEGDLFHWNAVLRGPEGTAYEGEMETNRYR